MAQSISQAQHVTDCAWIEFFETQAELQKSFRTALMSPSKRACRITTDLIMNIAVARPVGFEDTSSYTLLAELESEELRLTATQAARLSERGGGETIFNRLLNLQVIVDEVSSQLIDEDRVLPYK